MTHYELGGADRKIDPSAEAFERLDTAMLLDEYQLRQLTTSTEHLSIARLAHINPDFADIAEHVALSDTKWPDDESAVAQGPVELSIEPFIGRDAEVAFIAPILSVGSAAYNNFFVNLRTEHRVASKEAFAECMAKGDMLGMTYGTKPYIERAYALMPDFMNALQQATDQTGSMEDWNEAMIEGHVDPVEYPNQALLMRASISAYVILTRLMRSDDINIQRTMLGLSATETKPIVDPVVELRT